MRFSSVYAALFCAIAVTVPSVLPAQIPFPIPDQVIIHQIDPALLVNPLQQWQRMNDARLDAIMRWADQQPLVVSINEVMLNSSDTNEEKGEYIELYNSCAYALDISQWTISDNEATDTLKDYWASGLDTPGLLIPAHGYALIVDPDMGGMYNTAIANGSDPEDLIIVTVADDSIGNGLSNFGETITITTNWTYWKSTEKKKIVLSCPSQSAANYNGKSYRLKNGTWQLGGTPSPGFANY